MPIISKCPKCEQAVTIPDGIDPQAAVRCPLCEVEFPLAEAMAGAPPALIPVDAPPRQGLTADSDAMLKSDLVSEPFHVPGEELPVVPGGGDDSPTAESGPSDTGEPLLDVWKKDEAAAPEIDLGHGATSDAKAADFASFAEDEGDGEPADATTSGRASKPRRTKKKEKSAVRMILEPIVGGFVGLAVGYYALNYFGGERFDFMDFYLPGIPHTYKHKGTPDEQPSDQPTRQPAAKPGGAGRKPANNTAVQQVPPAVDPQPDPIAGPVAEPEPDVQPIAEPQPREEPLPDDYVGPVNVPSFSPDDLGKALKAAHEAVSGEDATGEVTPAVYEKFRQLGKVLSLARGDGPGWQLPDRRMAVEGILERIGEDPAQIDQIGRLSNELVDSEDGRQGGVLLAGMAGKVGEQDGLYGTVIRLAGHPTTVIVMSARPLAFQHGDQVVLLGTVINQPVKNLAGYRGSKDWLVWVGAAVSVQ